MGLRKRSALWKLFDDAVSSAYQLVNSAYQLITMELQYHIDQLLLLHKKTPLFQKSAKTRFKLNFAWSIQLLMDWRKKVSVEKKLDLLA